MHRQSHAYQRLVALYRRLLEHLRAAQDDAYRAFAWRIPLRLHVELLQPRLMLSVTASGLETQAASQGMVTPAVVMNAAGNSVMVWTSGSSGGQVFAQQFNASGTAVGSRILVNQSSTGGNAAPSLGMDSAGDFVVVWNAPGNSVRFRLFNSTGTATSSETLVTSQTTGNVGSSGVAMTPSGAFAIVWEGNFGTADNDGICAQQYTSAGLASGATVLVNTSTPGAQQNPSIAADSAGDFAVTWTDTHTVQSIDAAYWPAGGSLSSTIVVGGTSPQQVDNSKVAFTGAGNFVVAYDDTHGNGGIYSRRFAATTAIDAGSLLVNAVTDQNPRSPTLAARADGTYLVAWMTDSQGSAVTTGSDGDAKGIFAQAFTTANAADGGEFQVNTTAQNDQKDPSAAWTGDTAVIAWDSAAGGSNAGIFFQRYATTGAVNQAPTVTAPATQTTYKNVPLTFSTDNGNTLSVADADADGGQEQITLSAAHGVVSLSGTSGLTFTTGVGSADTTEVFTGSIADINAALQAMTFTPAAGYTGSASLAVGINDLGNSGFGGALSASRTISITVATPPTSTTLPAPQDVTENTPFTFSSASGNPVYIGNGWNYVQLQATHGKLTLATTSGLSFSTGDGTNDATMAFGGTVAAMNAALQGLVFTPTSGYVGSATLTVTTSTAGLLGLGLFASSASGSVALTISAPPPVANLAPAVAVPAAQSTAEGSPITMGGNAKISVSDADGGAALEQVTLVATSGTFTLSGVAGLSFSSGTGVSAQSATFTGTLADLNAALNGLIFTPASTFYGSGGLFISINDLGNTGTGGAKTANASVAVNVTEVNQPPTMALPGSLIASNTAPMLFSTATGNAIVAGDPDDNGAVEGVSLSTTAGTLTLAGASGVTITAGSNGSASMTVSGTLAAINSALDGLTLTAPGGFTGTATITAGVNDLGNSGAGGALSASGTLSVRFVSSLVVTTAADISDGDTSSINALLASPGADGKISLREAITAANNTAGLNEIDFDIAGAGVQTISVASSLPAISNSVIIDGSTQPGYAGVPLIELNGQAAAFGAIGLAIQASNSTIRGLSIYGFTGNGIDVLPVGANNITIQGNYVGITSTGTAIYNGTGIVLANSSNDLIGGTAAGERNIISGNFTYGVHIFGPSSQHDVVAGNFIGTDATGATAVPNGSIGVYVDGAVSNTIGLSSNGGGNVISGNGTYGIEVGGTSPAGNIIQANYVGLNAAGSAAISNGNDGIFLTGATGTIIGGTSAGAGNIVSGNTSSANNADGISIDGGSANVVQGNKIGVAADGTSPLGNYHAGIAVNASPGNTIGGISTGAANIIVYNNKGVVITGIGATANTLRGNAIFGNTAIGIDLGDDGITANSGTVSASLPNNGMNEPVFTSVSLTNGVLSVAGYTGLAAGQSAFAGATIDLFKSDQSQANGQGPIYLGSITADVNGNFSGTMSVSGLTPGDQITATATDPAGNTSEFAVNATVQLVNANPVIAKPGNQTTGENRGIVFSTANADAIVISDPDANGGVEQVTISVNGGTLSLSQLTGLAFQGGTANGSANLIFNGTLADINAALNGLVYIPPQDAGGIVTFNIGVNDLGNSGAGGAKTDSAALTIAVNAVAHTPSVTDSSTIVNTQTTDGLIITPDPADGNASGYYQISSIAGGTLYLSDGQTHIADGQFITFAQGAAGLKFTPSADSNAAGSFSVQASSTPSVGGLVGATVSATIEVGGPINTVPGAQSVAQDTALFFSSAGGNAISISDASGANDALIVDLLATHGTITLATTSGLTFDPSDTASHLRFSGSAAAVNAALNGLTFTPESQFAGNAGLSLTASDSQDQASSSVAITVAAANVPPPPPPPPPPQIAPVNSVPPDQSGTQDTTVVFSTSAGNGIVISDPGSDGSLEQVTLSASHGTLTLGTTAGVTLVSGTGAGDSSVTLSGSLTAIDAALQGLTFTPALHYNGSASISIVTQDLAGGGAPLLATNSIAINLAPATTTVQPPPPPPPPPATDQPPLPPQINTNKPIVPPTNLATTPTQSLPVVENGGGTTIALPAQTPSTDAPEDAPPPAAAATTGGTSRATIASVTNPVTAAVSQVLPRNPDSRDDKDLAVSLPPIVRNPDLTLANPDTISLSPNERITMELAALRAETGVRQGQVMLNAHHNATLLSGNATGTLAANSSLWRDLDTMEAQMTSERKVHVVAGAASLVSVGVSVMYFMWAVRAGSVLSSLLSSMPAWKLVDPLPILDQMAGSKAGRRARENEQDDETLESMVEGDTQSA